MAGRRDRRVVALIVAALLVFGAPSAAAGESGGGGGGEALASAKKKCKRKPGQKLTKKQRRLCRVKKIASTLTVTCPAAPVANGGAVTITGSLSPDRKGRSPLGAIWESSTPSPSDGNQSFFTSPGGSYAFSFASANPTAVPLTTTVRVDFAGDTLFADRRQASAQCQFTTLP